VPETDIAGIDVTIALLHDFYQDKCGEPQNDAESFRTPHPGKLRKMDITDCFVTIV